MIESVWRECFALACSEFSENVKRYREKRWKRARRLYRQVMVQLQPGESS